MGTKPCKWTTQRTVDLGVGLVTYSFLVIPECPCPLLGCDLLTKMRAQINFNNADPHKHLEGKAYRMFLTMPFPDMDTWLREFPTVWAETRGMGMARHWPPIYVELKANADPVKVHQYPKTLEAKKGITPHIRRLCGRGSWSLFSSHRTCPSCQLRNHTPMIIDLFRTSEKSTKYPSHCT